MLTETPPLQTAAGRVRTLDITSISRLFRFVYLANYFMLLTGVSMVLSIVTQILWTAGSAGEAVFYVIQGAVCAFSAWVGWHNIGILGAVVHKHTRMALLLLGGFFGLLAAAVLPQVNMSGEGSDRDSFVGGFVAILIALAAFGGLAAITILRRCSIPGLGVKLRTFLVRSIIPHPPDLPPMKPMNRAKGLGFLALGILWLVGLGYFPDEWLPESVRSRLYQVAVIGWGCFIYARHNLRPDFRTVWANDHRPPVLFLRSFADDEKVTYQTADSAWFDFSLESRLADHFSAMGPFIAVGAPGDTAPHLGAARASLTDDEWQGTVMGWMAKASLLIVMIGRTHWVGWELTRILELGYAGKLIIVFPQGSKWYRFRRRRDDAAARLTVIREAFAGTAWEPALRDQALPAFPHPDRLRSMVFLPNGEVAAVTSSARNRESYHLAALMARDIQLRAQGVAAPAEELVPVRHTVRRWAIVALVLLATGVSTRYLTSKSQPAIIPLAQDIPVTSNGNLVIGSFGYLDGKNQPHSSTFHAGDTVAFEYYIGGYGRGADGTADVGASYFLVAFDESRADLGPSRFHEPVDAPGEILRFNLSIPLADEAASGIYRFEIKVHDAVSGADFEFHPSITIEDRPK